MSRLFVILPTQEQGNFGYIQYSPVFRIREDPGYFQAMDPDPGEVKKEPKFGINI